MVVRKKSETSGEDWFASWEHHPYHHATVLVRFCIPLFPRLLNNYLRLSYIITAMHHLKLFFVCARIALFSLLACSKGAQSSDLEIEERQHRRKTSRHIRHTSWVDHVLRPGLDPDTVPFFILGTHKHDTACLPHVLTPPLMEALHKHLPMSCADTNFLLKYSLLRDGASTTALETRICMSKYTFLAIETLDGDVFGCFMTKVRA